MSLFLEKEKIFYSLYVLIFRKRIFYSLYALILQKNRDNDNPNINDFILIYEWDSNRNTCPDETEFVTCYSLV